MAYYLSKDLLQTLLANHELPRLDKVLLVLFFEDEKAKSTTEIKEIGATNGLREIVKWNVSDTLAKSKGKATLIKGNWVLTAPGKAYLVKMAYLTEKASFIKNDVHDLRSRLAKIADPQIKAFLEETITCLEADQKRAAVVLSWIGALAILYDDVVQNHLAAFNAEATKRDAKWKAAKNADDLGKLKEFDFLNILEAISVIGKNVKQELQQCLQLRNGCGHPNSLKIGTRKVAAHLETLILNVFTKF